MIKSLLIANRGEIAVRINRAAKGLGIRVVQACSEADKDALAAQLADDVVVIGPPQAAKSYLNIDAILAAALSAGVDAIHPGYGFLAESAEFASAVVDAGLIFVGPSAETISLLGDKVAARDVANKAGVLTVPGSDGGVLDVSEACSIASDIGYPVMIKSAAGGGGRGIRVCATEEELAHQFPQASAEAKAAFGEGQLYLEKFIKSARHIEVQIMGDGENAMHFYERECSLQRRRQKVWEEAPANCLTDELRTNLCNSAVALVKSVNYKGAGTVEFLYDVRENAFYFIEVNTRIQVEHPVTEYITGTDLVVEMIKIAGGAKLGYKQADIKINGHAIECRINAEDPTKDFMPWPGIITKLQAPSEQGVRFDTHIFEGYAIPPFYDSLIGKLIVHGANRDEALSKINSALSALVIEGIPTTQLLHLDLSVDTNVQNDKFDTVYLEQWLQTHEFSAPQGKLARAN